MQRSFPCLFGVGTPLFPAFVFPFWLGYSYFLLIDSRPLLNWVAYVIQYLSYLHALFGHPYAKFLLGSSIFRLHYVANRPSGLLFV
jgi:hypothetical protein